MQGAGGRDLLQPAQHRKLCFGSHHTTPVRHGSEWVSRDLVAEREVKKFNMKQTHVPLGKQSKLYAHIISNGALTMK